MRLVQRVRQHFAPIAALILLAALATGVYFFLDPERHVDRVLRQVEEKTGVEMVPGSVGYSFTTGEFVFGVSDLRLSPSASIRADEIRIAQDWTFLLNGELALGRLEFVRPHITIDLAGVDDGSAIHALQNLLTGIESLRFDDGLLEVNDSSLEYDKAPLLYEFSIASLDPHKNGKRSVSVGNDSDRASWLLSGTVDQQALSFVGRLEVEESSLSEHLWLCSQCEVEGDFSATAAVSWDQSKGVVLEGDLQFDRGRFRHGEYGVVLTWEAARVDQFSYAQSESSIELLTLEGGDLTITEEVAGMVAGLLGGTFGFTSVQLDYSGDIGWQGGSVSGGNKAEADDTRLEESRVDAQYTRSGGLSYRLAGEWRDLPVVVGGRHSSESPPQQTVTLENIKLEELDEQWRRVDGYKFNQGSLSLMLALNEQGGYQGQLVLSRQETVPVKPELDMERLRTLMVDADGVMKTPIRMDSILTRETVTERLVQEWQAILMEPTAYLEEVSSIKNLDSRVKVLPGQAVLTSEGKRELLEWAEVSRIRPNLSFSLRSVADKLGDGREVASEELEETLRDLYSLIDDSDKPIPKDVRGQLIEQMYLRMQNRKLPEVDSGSQQARIEQAEQWLIENWPVDPVKLQALAEDRLQLVDRFLEESGVPPEQIRHAEPVVSDGADNPVKIELAY